jgi:hypothetical protein
MTIKRKEHLHFFFVKTWSPDLSNFNSKKKTQSLLTKSVMSYKPEP